MSDFFTSLVGDIEDAGQEVSDSAGSAVEGGAHLLGKGMDVVGLHSAARAVDRAGDWVADHIGAHVGEAQLGESEDPKALIHGDVGALKGAAEHLNRFSSAFGETANGMGRLDTAHWQGKSADAFRQKFQPHPKQWADAHQACGDASRALGDYAGIVDWAQKQAAEAIDLYRRGKQESERAQQDYQHQVDSYNSILSAASESGIRGPQNGPAPTKPGPFHDPGSAKMQQAQHLLDDARKQRDSAAEQAAQAIKASTQLAPADPSFANKIMANVHDLASAGVETAAHVPMGLVQGVGGIVKMVRSVNMFDLYNVTHPAEYVQGLSTLAASLVHAQNHPLDTVTSLIGSGWTSDPGGALGRFEANAGAMFLSDGAGGAAESAGSAALRDAGTVEAGVGREIEGVSGSVKPIETAPAGAAPEPPPPPAQPPSVGGNYGEIPGGDFGPTGELPPDPEPAPQPGDHPNEPEPGDHSNDGQQPNHPEPGNLDAQINDALAHDNEYLSAENALNTVRDQLREVPQGSDYEKYLIEQRDVLNDQLDSIRTRVAKQVRDGLY